MKKYVILILIMFTLTFCKQSNDNNIENQSFNTTIEPILSPEEIAKSSIDGYNLALNRNPNDRGAYYGRGCSEMELTNYKEAIADFTTALSIKSDEDIDFEILCHRANCKNFLLDYNGAIKDFTKAINIDPNYEDPYSGRAESYLKIGLTKKACTDWQSLIDMGFIEYKDSITKYKK